MNDIQKEFETVLRDEEFILNSVIEKQLMLKTTVINKDWENLTKTIAQINELSNSFVEADEKRNAVQEQLKTEELKPYFEQLRNLRSKLLRCKIENQSLSKYINITREFIQEVIGKAMPGTGSKVYSKSGKILQTQPQSVVLNMSF